MFAVSHPLLVMIREKKIFLESIINNFPTLKSLINAEVNNNAQQIAQEIADGDKEIEQEEQSKIVNAFDDSNDLDNLFYQAMFIMVCSYYDGAVERLCKENDITDTKGDRISKLCTLKGIELSDKTTKHKKFIFENLKSLRHDIVHNNIGTLKNSEKIYSLMRAFILKLNKKMVVLFSQALSLFWMCLIKNMRCCMNYVKNLDIKQS